MTNQSTPATIYPCLYDDDAPAAIDWLCNAFGFRKRMVVPGPDGTIAHYERATSAGAEIIRGLKDEEYGSRGYMVKGPEGNQWYFGTYRPGAYRE